MSKFIRLQNNSTMINTFSIRRIYIAMLLDDGEELLQDNKDYKMFEDEECSYRVEGKYIYAELTNKDVCKLGFYTGVIYAETIFDEIMEFLSSKQDGCYACPEVNPDTRFVEMTFDDSSFDDSPFDDSSFDDEPEQFDDMI